jgi:hypothetical protein
MEPQLLERGHLLTNYQGGAEGQGPPGGGSLSVFYTVAES